MFLGTLIVPSRSDSMSYSSISGSVRFLYKSGSSSSLAAEGLIPGFTYIKARIRLLKSVEYLGGKAGYYPLMTFLYSPCIS
mmetsp:Transcript_31380/g.5665  ORF Transcript_31380/g.5665 Transcript_31380/m.5665 type:complete len:81 (+) Transcript_31380:449-691(+)